MLEEEAQFFARAEADEFTTTAEIWRAFESRVGHHLDNSTIYRPLNRYDWRKLMPRSRYPKADLKAQERLKKLCHAGSSGSRHAPSRG